MPAIGRLWPSDDDDGDDVDWRPPGQRGDGQGQLLSLPIVNSSSELAAVVRVLAVMIMMNIVNMVRVG